MPFSLTAHRAERRTAQCTHRHAWLRHSCFLFLLSQSPLPQKPHHGHGGASARTPLLMRDARSLTSSGMVPCPGYAAQGITHKKLKAAYGSLNYGVACSLRHRGHTSSIAPPLHVHRLGHDLAGLSWRMRAGVGSHSSPQPQCTPMHAERKLWRVLLSVPISTVHRNVTVMGSKPHD